MANLSFEPLDRSENRNLTIRFREDSFVASFGDADQFHEADGRGADRYIAWLTQKIADDPHSVVHVLERDDIIGQLELAVLTDDVGTGYVNLYYLREDRRDGGLGAQLDRYAERYFRSRGLKRARLSVSPANARAFRFYEKMGWRDLGLRPGHPEVHLMEKSYP